MPLLLVLLTLVLVLLPGPQGFAQETKSFRAIAVACDLPEGLRLSIDDQPVRAVYPTGKVTNLSAFRPGTYAIRAESPGCLPYDRPQLIEPGKIHTWIFYTVPLRPGDRPDKNNNNSKDQDKLRSPAGGGPPPTRVLMLHDLTAPSRITQPATVLLDLTGSPDGITLQLDGKPVRLRPRSPKVLAPRPPGTNLDLHRRSSGVRPFFSQKVGPGKHAVVAIFRKNAGGLAAVMKTL